MNDTPLNDEQREHLHTSVAGMLDVPDPAVDARAFTIPGGDNSLAARQARRDAYRATLEEHARDILYRATGSDALDGLPSRQEQLAREMDAQIEASDPFADDAFAGLVQKDIDRLEAAGAAGQRFEIDLIYQKLGEELLGRELGLGVRDVERAQIVERGKAEHARLVALAKQTVNEWKPAIEASLPTLRILASMAQRNAAHEVRVARVLGRQQPTPAASAPRRNSLFNRGRR
jgi:hypothetical protein